MLTGSFACGSLSGSPFLILRGDFRLFQTDSRTPDTMNIIYDFDMISSEGDRIHFYGEKIIDPSVTLSPRRVWKATSTLYVTLTRRADNVVISRGILNLEPRKFVSELRTLIGAGEDQTSKNRDLDPIFEVLLQAARPSFPLTLQTSPMAAAHAKEIPIRKDATFADNQAYRIRR